MSAISTTRRRTCRGSIRSYWHRHAIYNRSPAPGLPGRVDGRAASRLRRSEAASAVIRQRPVHAVRRCSRADGSSPRSARGDAAGAASRGRGRQPRSRYSSVRARWRSRPARAQRLVAGIECGVEGPRPMRRRARGTASGRWPTLPAMSAASARWRGPRRRGRQHGSGAGAASAVPGSCVARPRRGRRRGTASVGSAGGSSTTRTLSARSRACGRVVGGEARSRSTSSVT